LISAVPHGTYLECFADPDRDPIWQALWRNRPGLKDGLMPVSAGPGFGLELDQQMIAKYRVAGAVTLRRLPLTGERRAIASAGRPAKLERAGPLAHSHRHLIFGFHQVAVRP